MNKPLHVVMTPVRNEAWVLRAFLEATSLWADYIIIADQMSTDGSREIAGNSPTRVLPDVADNCSLREAQAKLKAMGFKLGPVEYIPGDKDWVYAVKCRGRFVYSGEQVPTDVPLILQVGKDKSIDAEEEMLDSIEAMDFDAEEEEAVGFDDIFDL